MTIFLEIAKQFLITEITTVRDNSVAADSSLGNSALSFFGLGRDETLSKAKRGLADELLTTIRNMADKESDEATLQELVAQITKCKKTAASKSDAKGYDEGTFGPAMKEAISLVEEIFDKLKEVKLTNVASDKDPLNLFRYYAASYFAQKIDDARKLGALGSIAQHPKLSSFRKLTAEKEMLVIEMLQACEKDLETLNKELEGYPATRKSRVLEWLEKLQRANVALCKSYGSKISIPITFALFSTINLALPTLRPDSGFLEQCIQSAMHKIEPEVEHRNSLVV